MRQTIGTWFNIIIDYDDGRSGVEGENWFSNSRCIFMTECAMVEEMMQGSQSGRMMLKIHQEFLWIYERPFQTEGYNS